MTTELILLLAILMFVVIGSVVNTDSGLEATFKKSAPKLGARIEKHIETGSGFPEGWGDPPKATNKDVPE